MSRSKRHSRSAANQSLRKRLSAKLRKLRTKIFGTSKRRHVRRYADPAIGRLGLFQKLHERNIRYVVLRWFNELPDWPSGEDVDILIDIRDLERVDDLFVRNDQSIPCDIYASTAAKGADMRGLPYYPANLAEQLLESRVMHNGYCYVPDPEKYFLSLAFHAVYHKAESAGLPWDDSTPCDGTVGDGDHNYASVLRPAVPPQFGDVPMTLVGLHQFLTKHRWAPAIDTLRKYAIFRPCLDDLVPEQISNQDGELLLFVFRQAALDYDIVDESIAMLERKHRLEVVSRIKLTEQESKLGRSALRCSGSRSTPIWPSEEIPIRQH